MMGQQGFENSCKTIKNGSHFCRDIASILQERAELESQYFKNLNKLSTKLVKIAQQQCQQLLLTNSTDSIQGTADPPNVKKKAPQYTSSDDVRNSSRKKALLNTGGNAAFAAWEVIGKEMDAEAQIHKNFSLALAEDLAKPLNTISKAHSDARKIIEGTVEKACKAFEEARIEEIKDKISCFEAQKQLERLRETIDGSRGRKNSESGNGVKGVASNRKKGNGPPLSEKDLLKAEEKILKSVEASKKSDHAYHDSCLKSERCRQERDAILDKSYRKLNSLERERLRTTRDVLVKYLASVAVIPSKLNQILENISKVILDIKQLSDTDHGNRSQFSTGSPIASSSSASSSPYASSTRGSNRNRPSSGEDSGFAHNTSSTPSTTSPPMETSLSSSDPPAHKDFRTQMADQNLYDYYAEDFSSPMNLERRKQTLERTLVILRQDIEKERAAKESVEHLAKVYKEIPKFSDQSSARDIRDKLLQCHHTSNFLEASFFKVACALAELESKPKPTHPLGKYIETKRSKQGILNSVLRVPPWDDQVGLVKFNRSLESLLPSLLANSVMARVTTPMASPTSDDGSTINNASSPGDQSSPSQNSTGDGMIKFRKSSGRRNSGGSGKGKSTITGSEKEYTGSRIGCGLSFTGMGRNLFGKPVSQKGPKMSSAYRSSTAESKTTSPTGNDRPSSATSALAQHDFSHHGSNQPYRDMDQRINNGNASSSFDRGNDSYVAVSRSADDLIEDGGGRRQYFTPPTSLTDLPYKDPSAITYSRSNPNIPKEKDILPPPPTQISAYNFGGGPGAQASPPPSYYAGYSYEPRATTSSRHPDGSYHHYYDHQNSGVTGHGGRPNNNRVCIVKYEYTAARPDELTIKPGDIVEILHKQVDGWWKGCKIVPNGEIGIFPSTYVQELAMPSPSSATTSASHSPSPSAPRHL